MKQNIKNSIAFPYGKKGESLFKNIKNYTNYSPMLNWWIIRGRIKIPKVI